MFPDNPVARLLAVLENARPLVRREAASADRRGVLPDEVVRLLIEHGFFRLWIPRRYEGLELSLPEALEIYEAAARIDGAFGWSVMIGAGGGLFAAYLEDATAREIYGGADAVIAGSGAPEGRAERVSGGYRVHGRWRYASGSPYATTFTANCIVTSGEEPVRVSDDVPLIRAMAFARDDVEIIETWDATGMRATASHDFRVQDVFVPERRSFSVFTDAPREEGPLYRLPFQVLTELPVLAVALGVARQTLDHFAELAGVKRPLGAATVLGEDPATAAAYARAHAAWHLARTGASALAQQVWQTAVTGREPTRAACAEITATCTYAAAELRACTDGLVAFAGMRGIDRTAHLARAAQDLAALGGHFSVSPRQLAAAGATLLSTAGHSTAGAREAESPYARRPRKAR